MDVLRGCMRVQKQAYYRRVARPHRMQAAPPARPQDTDWGPLWPEDGRPPYLN